MGKRKNENPVFNEVLFYYWKLLIEEKSKQDEELEKTRKRLNAEIQKNRQYKNELVQSSIRERWQIGEYLHDTLAQTLVSAKIMINQLKSKIRENKTDVSEDIDEILRIIDDSIRGARDLSHEVIPIDVEKEGVSQAFKLLEVRAERNSGVNCTMETDEIIHRINNREVATNLYHIAQEAIKNAINHGGASNIKISVTEQNRQLNLNIKDDGKGFDASNVNEGMGITIMKHRSEEMGGSFRINELKEEEQFKTCVSCKLPLENIELKKI